MHRTDPKDAEAAQAPLRFRFNPPIDFDGKSYHKLVFDFDGLNDEDFDRADHSLLKLYIARRKKTPVTADSQLYTCILAAQLANVPVGLIESLPLRYYRAIRAELLKVYAARGRKRQQE